MTRVVLHIDRLVLRGVDGRDAAAVERALQGELQRLLAVPDAQAYLMDHDRSAHVGVGKVRTPQGADAGALGRAVAKGIVRGGGS